MVTTLSSLGAVLEAFAAILAVIDLTKWSINVGSENGFGAIIDAVGGGISSYPCLSDASTLWDAKSSRSPFNSPFSGCTGAAGTWEEVSAKGSQSGSLSKWELWSLPRTRDELVQVPCLVLTILKHISKPYQYSSPRNNNLCSDTKMWHPLIWNITLVTLSNGKQGK
jgi:hypothetical protein